MHSIEKSPPVAHQVRSSEASANKSLLILRLAQHDERMMPSRRKVGPHRSRRFTHFHVGDFLFTAGPGATSCTLCAPAMMKRCIGVRDAITNSLTVPAGRLITPMMNE